MEIRVLRYFLELHVKEICQGLLKDFMLHSQRCLNR